MVSESKLKDNNLPYFLMMYVGMYFSVSKFVVLIRACASKIFLKI